MIELIKHALRLAGILPRRNSASFINRRSYHLSVFTELVDKLKKENDEIEQEKALQCKKIEELKSQIEDLRTEEKQLSNIVNQNLSTVDKISNII